MRMRDRDERCGAWQLSLILIRSDSPADLARCPRVCVCRSLGFFFKACQVGVLVTPAMFGPSFMHVWVYAVTFKCSVLGESRQEEILHTLQVMFSEY